MTCATCRRLLTHSDAQKKVLRCAVCRKAKPGRDYAMQPHRRQPNKMKPQHWRNYAQQSSKKLPYAEMMPRTSWWTEPALLADRQAFMAKAAAESQAMRVRRPGPVLSTLLTP